MLAHTATNVEGPIHPSGIGVRAGRFMYMQLGTSEIELYDASTDPFELTNLAGDPRWAAVQAQLAATLQTVKTCAGAGCRFDVPNLEPVADIAWSCDGRSCSFDGSASIDGEGPIVSYEWDFGDGDAGGGAVAAHEFAEAGTYVVTLSVVDDEGARTTTQVDVTVD
jgi:hypothetical protein